MFANTERLYECKYDLKINCFDNIMKRRFVQKEVLIPMYGRDVEV